MVTARGKGMGNGPDVRGVKEYMAHAGWWEDIKSRNSSKSDPATSMEFIPHIFYCGSPRRPRVLQCEHEISEGESWKPLPLLHDVAALRPPRRTRTIAVTQQTLFRYESR